MVIEYDGLTTEQAIAKLKAKSFHDEGDKAFARALSTHFSPEELAAITGDDIVEVPEVVGDISFDLSSLLPKELTSEAEYMKLTLEVLQAKAAELEIDPSGTKREIVAKILAFFNEKQELEVPPTEETV